MRKTIPLLSFFICARLLSAQSPTTQTLNTISNDPLSLASRQMEIFNRVVEDEATRRASQAAGLQAEQLARREFREKAQKFVSLWGDFAVKLNDEHVFDAKLAKKLSKAFHELETSDGWPVRADK